MLKDVGSYGRQLGRIGDALLVLLNHVRLDDLTPVEHAAITALRDQLTGVGDTKARLAKVRGTPETAAPAEAPPRASSNGTAKRVKARPKR
jgi:hypothetical protein